MHILNSGYVFVCKWFLSNILSQRDAKSLIMKKCPRMEFISEVCKCNSFGCKPAKNCLSTDNLFKKSIIKEVTNTLERFFLRHILVIAYVTIFRFYLKDKISDDLLRHSDSRGHTHTQSFAYYQCNQILPFHISSQNQHQDLSLYYENKIT